MVSGTTCVFYCCSVCFFISVPVTSVGRGWWQVAGRGQRQPEPPEPGQAGQVEADAARLEAWGNHDKLVRRVSEEVFPFIASSLSVSPQSLRCYSQALSSRGRRGGGACMFSKILAGRRTLFPQWRLSRRTAAATPPRLTRRAAA